MKGSKKITVTVLMGGKTPEHEISLITGREVNTIPGLTPMSLLPKAAMAIGLSYPKLIDRIIEYALE